MVISTAEARMKLKNILKEIKYDDKSRVLGQCLAPKFLPNFYSGALEMLCENYFHGCN